MEEEQAARTLVQAHLRGRTRWTLAVGAVLLVLTVGGCGEFFRSVDASEALAHSGVKTKARIDSASNYRRHSVVEGHLYVTYEAPQGVERHVRVWLPEDTHYRAGGSVEVAYDRHNPRRAVLTKGGDPGPVALWSFLAVVVCVIALFVLVHDRRKKVQAARSALTEQPSRTAISTALRRTSPFYKQRRFSVESSTFTAMTKKDWHLPDGPVDEALVFTGRDATAVVDVASRSVAISGGD
jgi:hypothetical protein